MHRDRNCRFVYSTRHRIYIVCISIGTSHIELIEEEEILGEWGVVEPRGSGVADQAERLVKRGSLVAIGQNQARRAEMKSFGAELRLQVALGTE